MYLFTWGAQKRILVSHSKRAFGVLVIWVLRENQADIIETFDAMFRYLDNLLNIDNIYFDQMVGRIYPTELQLNKVSSSDTEAPFLDLNLCISNGIVSTKNYDKRDDFDFDIGNFLFWMAMSPGVAHMGYTYLNLLGSSELLQI